MNISLTPALEKYVQDKVACGLYNSVSEVVREAIRLLIEKDRVPQEYIEKLKKDIQVGLDDPVTLEGHSAMKELMKKYE